MMSADAMTDAKKCIAYFGPSSNVQMTKDSFAIAYGGRGGIGGYTLRFDNEAPDEMALPNRVEQEVGAFVIESSDPRWPRIRTSKRLRVRTLTVLSSLVDDDIDLTQQPEVFAILNGPKCN